MKYLKELRQRKDVSQQNVADYLEITRQAYSNYENGNRTPDNETLLKLAEYFDVTVDMLLRGEPSAMGDDDIRFALFGDVAAEITDEDMADVRLVVDLIKRRKQNKKEGR